MTNYLRILDARCRWKAHIKKKRKEVKIVIRRYIGFNLTCEFITNITVYPDIQFGTIAVSSENALIK